MKAEATSRLATWTIRIAFSIVLAWNLICAVQFIADPASYASAYQLSGTEGEVALRGLGVAFLMWNVTYPAFIVAPQRFKALGAVIVVQQVIGLVGESIIFANLPAGFEVLASSIQRFIAFDGTGLILMILSFLIALFSMRKISTNPRSRRS